MLHVAVQPLLSLKLAQQEEHMWHLRTWLPRGRAWLLVTLLPVNTNSGVASSKMPAPTTAWTAAAAAALMLVCSKPLFIWSYRE